MIPIKSDNKIWIVVSSSLGEPKKPNKWSSTPLIMETDLLTKEEATEWAKKLSKKYSGYFYIVKADLGTKELIDENNKH